MNLTPAQEELKREIQRWVSEAARAPASAVSEALSVKLDELAARIDRLEAELERRKAPCNIPSQN